MTSADGGEARYADVRGPGERRVPLDPRRNELALATRAKRPSRNQAPKDARQRGRIGAPDTPFKGGLPGPRNTIRGMEDSGRQFA